MTETGGLGLRAQGGAWSPWEGGPHSPRLALSGRVGAVVGEGGSRLGQGQQEGQAFPPTASPFLGSELGVAGGHMNHSLCVLSAPVMPGVQRTSE